MPTPLEVKKVQEQIDLAMRSPSRDLRKEWHQSHRDSPENTTTKSAIKDFSLVKNFWTKKI